uniref:RUS family member 1 n=1 Tax=Paramormyrops kingsleyae TaxID=1676925 RepID=A0A3B3TFU6_9TELE
MSVKRFLCVLFMMMGHVLRGAVCHREGAFGSDLYTCWFPQMAPGCWAEYCLRGSKGEHGAISHICVSLSCVSSLTCYCPCAHPSQEQTGLRCQEMEVRLGECPWKGAGKVGIQPFPMPLLRLVADVLNDIAMFMEILAPSFPACFTFIVCIAGILKSIVGVAGGATRAALTLHQARRDNMADVSAKDGSQETLVNLAGLLVSLVLIPLVTNNALLTFVLFFSFTVLHLLANYKAVRSIVMETLNEARLSILLHQYLHDGRILSPSEANSREPVFLEFRRRVPIKFGVKFGDLITRYVCRPSLLSFLSSPVCFLCPSFFFSLPFLFLPMSLFTLAHPVVLSFLPLSFLFSVSCCPFLSSSVFSLLFSVSCCPFLSSCRCSPAHSVSFVICFLLSFLSCSVFPVSLSFFSFSASSPLLHVFPVPFLSSCLFSPVQFSLCPFFSPFCLFSLLPVLLSVSFPAKFPGHPAWTLPRPLRERV